MKKKDDEISVQEIRVLAALLSGGWMTNAQLSKIVKGVAPRTIRSYTRRLASRGILERAKVFPAHRFRIAMKACAAHQVYFRRVAVAAEASNEPFDFKVKA